ncbi:MAG: MFS transporter [Gammaproteobacteria bacterium]|nr:MFS transporter [Gammaproteobacteria bacterium]
MNDLGGAQLRAHPTLMRQGLSLALIALTLALAYGSWYAYSVFLVALLNDFGWSRSTLGGAFSLFAIVQGAANPVLGMVCDKVRPPAVVAVGSIALGATLYLDSYINEPWHLYVCFGGLTAVAVALCGWIPAVVQVQRRFQRRLGLALGIVSSGVGVGMLVVVPLCEHLIEAHGWREAFRVLAMICTAFTLPAALFLWWETPAHRPPAPRAAAALSMGNSMTLREATRTAPFWLMVGTFFCGSLCSQSLHVHQVAFLVDHGISAMVAASVVGVVGVASIVGKTGGGWLSDRIERELVYIGGVSVLVASVGALLLVGAQPTPWGVYTYAVMLGIGYAVTAAIMPAMVADRFHGRHFGSILGVGLFGSAAGSAFGPWMSGYLHDLTGSYTLPFSIAALTGLLACAAGALARHMRRAALAARGA